MTLRVFIKRFPNLTQAQMALDELGVNGEIAGITVKLDTPFSRTETAHVGAWDAAYIFKKIRGKWHFVIDGGIGPSDYGNIIIKVPQTYWSNVEIYFS